jgi:NAD(P)-dependent dehydrogenase (short-subunit alcohol dehydrogenase family)
VLLGGDDDLMGEPTPAIDRTLATNLRGPILLCKYALPLLLEQPGGRVVNVSSAMGRLSRSHDATAASYRLSKVGVNGLTVYLDEAYGDRGLLANAVTPGWVRTRLGGEDADRSVEAGAETPVWLTRFRPGSPAGLFWRDREPRPW